jgi:carboxymethylenebutenolidase
MSAPNNKDIITENVTCAGGMPAFVARPKTGGSRPCIVLMHERYGLVQHTKDLAARFAGDGYVCIAPDVFFRHADQDALHRGDDRCDITDDDAIRDLSAAIDALKGVSGADASKVAVKGVCQTGRHPLALAAVRPISAALVWYGAASKREWETNKLQPRPLTDVIRDVPCPVFGSFGEADHIISLDDVRRFRNCLEDHKKTYEIHVFKDAPHGWLNDTMPGRYRREQAEAGWKAQLKFLDWVFDAKRDRNMISWKYECQSRPNYDFTKNVRLE